MIAKALYYKHTIKISSSAQNHHPNLKKSIAPLLHIVLFLISAGIGP